MIRAFYHEQKGMDFSILLNKRGKAISEEIAK